MIQSTFQRATKMAKFIEVQDSRIQSLVDRTLDTNFKSTYTELDLAKYSKALVRETVLECMKQAAMAVDIKDYDTSITISKIWDHLAKRYKIAEQ